MPIYSSRDWKLVFCNKYLSYMESLTCAIRVQVSMTQYNKQTFVGKLRIQHVIITLLSIIINWSLKHQWLTQVNYKQE